jgi:hypothetical protein
VEKTAKSTRNVNKIAPLTPGVIIGANSNRRDLNPRPLATQASVTPSKTLENVGNSSFAESGCTSESKTPESSIPDLFQLLTQFGALPAEQRDLIAKLLTPSAPTVAPPAMLDDSLPPGFEKAKWEAS